MELEPSKPRAMADVQSWRSELFTGAIVAGNRIETDIARHGESNAGGGSRCGAA
jgi:hypothetical protein